MFKQSTDESLLLKNKRDTIQLGISLYRLIPNLQILLLEGPLGAGKTTLVKGLAVSLDIKEEITSPSFALAQHYMHKNKSLIHLDLYRLENPNAANELFLEEEEQAKIIKATMVVEWPERLGIKIKDAWRIKLAYRAKGGRIAQLMPPGYSSINFSTSN